MKKLAVFVVLFLLSSQAMASYSLTGKVVNEADQPIAHATVNINDQHVKTDAQGHYQLAVTPQDIYRISIAAKGFFNIHQTFSHYELSLKHARKFSINDITLVKKAKGRTLLAFGGDVMMGRRYAKPYFNNPVLIHADSIQEDTKALVKQIKPYMSAADFAAVNLETQIASEQPDQRAPKSVTFFSPPQTLDALQWAGIDYVTLGNNHTYDYLDSGLKSSLGWLKKSQLGYSGAGINEQQALAPYRTSLNGNEFSMLGFVGWEGGFSPNQTASHDKGGAAFGSMTNITNTVKTESAANRATIVQYHGSQEYAPEPTLMTEQRLKSAIDHGADLAIAHHPHVTQGFELYNGKLIAYSMGNFIFDQFFYSTPHSFILYVWMDGETFHRAEIVPIYLKGYQPTPSTGAHRDNVLKRLTQLSKKRGVIIGMSGGHGVINSRQSSQENTSTHLLSVNTSIAPLPLGHWAKQLSGIASDTNGLKYRLGVNLVNGSDFETFGSFDSDERGWNIDDNKFTLTSQDAFSGQYAMSATLAVQASDSLAMTNFRRVYRGGNPMSITLKVKVSQDTQLTLAWQGRKTRDKFFSALNTREHNQIDTINLTGSEQWQTIEVAFNSPRVGYRSLRVLATFDNKSANDSEVFVDDFAFIEWQSAFRGINSALPRTGLSNQASYIQLNQPDNNVTLSYQ